MTEAHRPPEPVSAVVPSGIRVGTELHDITAIEALIQRHGRRYLDQTFTAQEVQACGGYDADPHRLAPGLTARFCAKEATLKILRPTAILPEWPDLEVVNMPGGWLRLELSGAARQIADERRVIGLQVSVSDDGSVAVATVVGFENHPPNVPVAPSEPFS